MLALGRCKGRSRTLSPCTIRHDLIKADPQLQANNPRVDRVALHLPIRWNVDSVASNTIAAPSRHHSSYGIDAMLTGTRVTSH